MRTKNILIGMLAVLMIGNAIFSLLGKKYIPTHDGEYHIIRIVEFSKMLSAGYLFPRWAPDLNSGYGIPIFQYHYPLPNYIGAVFRLVTKDAVYAFQLSSAFAYIFLVIGLWYWLRYFFPLKFALIGALIGSYTPYVFLDLYVRGAIGEVWAMGFLAFTLGALERKKYYAAAIVFACLILSHNISAMVFGAFLGIYSHYRSRSIWYLFEGVLFSSFFWMPALFEQKYVVGLNTVNFRDHFVQLYEFLVPSWGTGFSSGGSMGNKMSFQIGIIPLIILFSSFTRMFKETNIRFKKLLIFFAYSLGVLLLLFPFSKPVWDLLSPLQLIQYPWRLLSIVIPVTAFGASYWLFKRNNHILTIVILVLTIGVTWKYVRPVQYEPRSEAYYLSRKNFTDGTSSMGNSFSTIWTPWKQSRFEAPVTSLTGEMSATKGNEYLDREFTVNMSQMGIVDLHILYFPGWTAYIDGKKSEIHYKENGNIRVYVPIGVHSIRVRLEETPLRTFADLVSIASVIVAAVCGILSVRKASLYAYRN